jgi:hypothetical protein
MIAQSPQPAPYTFRAMPGQPERHPFRRLRAFVVTTNSKFCVRATLMLPLWSPGKYPAEEHCVGPS